MATLICVKQLVYIHTLTRPILVVLSQAAARWVSGWLTPLATKLIPGRQSAAAIRLGILVAALLVQIVCLVILAQLIELCIDLAELWAILAHKHLEITLDETT